MSLGKCALSYAITTAVAALYYAMIAPGVLATLSLAIPISPTAPVYLVAVAWVLLEAIAIGIPFVALAMLVRWWPSLLPRNIWLAPLALVVAPVVLSALWNLWTIGALRSDVGIGGELVAELSMAVDVVAALLGSALVIVSLDRPREPVSYRANAASRAGLGVTRH